MKDSDLLTQFTQGSNAAFSELVRRHLDLVFATALRHVAGDRHRAEDITQQVFIALARKARTLTSHPALEGWLYSSTRYAALNALRREQRRSQREKQSEAMSTPTEGSEPRWEQIRPVIDEALQELDDDDRQSVVLRFFAQQPFATIAVQLGISENAAQKRVDRALDQLNVALKRRGIFSPAAALAVALGDSCIAAPATLAGTVTTAALAHMAVPAAGTFVVAGWLKGMAVAATVGIVGWVSVKWSQVPAAERGPVSPPVVAPAKPQPVATAANYSPHPDPPRALEPVPDRPMNTTTPPPAAVRHLYVVRAGDTLRRIASAVGVTPEALHAENPGYNFPRMRVGDQVRLPAGAALPPPPTVARVTPPIPGNELYIVQPGDTLLKIARKRELLPDELKAMNPGTDWQKLRIGQKFAPRKTGLGRPHSAGLCDPPGEGSGQVAARVWFCDFCIFCGHPLTAHPRKLRETACCVSARSPKPGDLRRFSQSSP